MEAFDGYIVDDVVESPLGKRRVDVAERDEPVLCHAAREGYGMAFGNPDVEGAVGHGFHQDVHGTARWHGGGDADDSRIGLRQFQQGFPENVLIAGGEVAGVRFDAFAGFFVELSGSVPHVRGFFRRLESFSFHGVDVEQFRAFHFFQCPQRVYQFNDVMTVAGAEITNIHAFEHVLLVADERFQRIVEADEALAAFLVEPSPTEQFL